MSEIAQMFEQEYGGVGVCGFFWFVFEKLDASVWPLPPFKEIADLYYVETDQALFSS